jgi:hypothetical protein
MLKQWQIVSANDPPQSLRRRSLAATLAVSLFLVATAACVLLADRPKGFVLEEKPSADEVKYMTPLMASVDNYSGKVLSRELSTIFSRKNELTSDKVAAAALAASPEYQELKRKSVELSNAARLKAAAAARLFGHKLRAIDRQQRAEHDAIAAAIKKEKASEAKLIRFARSKGHVVTSSSPSTDSSLLKIFASVAALDATPSAKPLASASAKSTGPAASLQPVFPRSTDSPALSRGSQSSLSEQAGSLLSAADTVLVDTPLGSSSRMASSPSSRTVSSRPVVQATHNDPTTGSPSLSDAAFSDALSASSVLPQQAPSTDSPFTLSSSGGMDARAAAAAAEAEVENAQEALNSLAGIEDN